MPEEITQKEMLEKIVKEQGEQLDIGGSWFIVAGTLITAFGQSRNFLLSGEIGLQSVATGNAVEAFGNSLQAIGLSKEYSVSREEYPLQQAIMGCWLQAGGNITNTVATEIEIKSDREDDEELKRDSLKLNALGSGVQSLGASMEAIAFSELKPTPGQELIVTGNGLIALGSSIDAIGNTFLLQEKEEEGDILLLAGAWIQAIGAMYELYGLTINTSISEEDKNGEGVDNLEERAYSYGMYKGGTANRYM
ncbi:MULTISPECIES: DUF6944 family repetitive protein [Bacillus]|uniref:DUF6944 family repetitive protein n=1 Tax=Bacillus TaxID=1386 RepID=UPI0002D82442|nr:MULTISPECIES: hypothetical protein [Bacillus]